MATQKKARRVQFSAAAGTILVLLSTLLPAAGCMQRGSSAAAPAASAPAKPKPPTEWSAGAGRTERADTPEQRARLQACALDLCGSPQDRLQLEARGPFEADAQDEAAAFFSDQASALVDRLFEANVQALLARADTLDALMADGRTIDFSRAERTLLAVISVTFKWSSQLESSLRQERGRFWIDLPAFRRLAPRLSEFEAQKIAVLVEAFVNDESMALARSARNMTLDAWLAHVFTTPAPGFISRQLRAFLEAAIRIEEEFGPITLWGVDRQSLISVIESESVSGPSATGAMAYIRRVLALSAYLSPDVQKAAEAVELSLADIGRAVEWPKRSERIRRELGSPEARERIRSMVVRECRAAIVRSVRSAPDAAAARATIERTVPAVKEAARSAARSYFLEQDLAGIDETILAVRFSPPLHRDAVKAAIARRLQIEANAAKSAQDLAAESRQRRGRWQSFLAVSLALAEDENGRFMSDAIESCQDLLQSKPIDRIFPKVDAPSPAQLSWHSVRFPGHGAGVIAHEIGHAVFSKARHLNSGGPFSRPAQCSADLHASLDDAPVGSDAAKRFAEEDWADAFAATTLRQLKARGSPASNFGCLLLRVAESGSEDEKLGFVATDPNDSHSPPLLRALQIHAGLGAVAPRSCEEALGSAKAPHAVRSCAL